MNTSSISEGTNNSYGYPGVYCDVFASSASIFVYLLNLCVSTQSDLTEQPKAMPFLYAVLNFKGTS